MNVPCLPHSLTFVSPHVLLYVSDARFHHRQLEWRIIPITCKFWSCKTHHVAADEKSGRHVVTTALNRLTMFIFFFMFGMTGVNFVVLSIDGYDIG